MFCDGDLNLQPPWLQRSPLDSIQICGIGRRFLWVNQHLKSENHGIVTAPEKNTHTHVHKQEHTHQITKQLSQLRTQRRRLKRIQSLQIVTFCNSEHKKVLQVLTFKALEKCSAKCNKTFFPKVDTVQIWKYNGITLVLKTSKHFCLLAVLFDHYFKKLWGCVQGFRNGFQFTEYNAPKNLNRFCKTHPPSLYLVIISININCII